MIMANTTHSRIDTPHSGTAHTTGHHAFGFQQVMTAVTHALARKEQSHRQVVSQRTQLTLDKQRTAASATGSWAEILLR
jgi:hypothetical protein